MGSSARPSRYRQMSAEARLMLALGESGRYEFKRDADAVTPRILAALANWVSLDEAADVAHLLVGVDEQEDETTGLVLGIPCGLPKGLDRSVSRILGMATSTKPIPVDVFVIEEDVEKINPFLRVEVRPTMAPHFDDEGRRQTRQGRSTRALTDDEMLRIYLDREAGSFAARFRQTSTELQTAVGAVGEQVGQVADAIERTIARPIAELADSAEYAAVSASGAQSAAETISYDVVTLERRLEAVGDLIEKIHATSPEEIAGRVLMLRRRVWWNLTADTWERSSVQADRLARHARHLLGSDIHLDGARNAWELRAWGDLLRQREQQRGAKGTLTWWRTSLDEVARWLADPAYQAPELPDLRTELREDFDKALDDPESLTRRFEALLDPRK